MCVFVRVACVYARVCVCVLHEKSMCTHVCVYVCARARLQMSVEGRLENRVVC